MKSINRIHRNGAAKTHNKQVAFPQADEAAARDQEIVKNYGAISAAERLDYARQLEQQAADLYESAFEMDRRLKRPAPPKGIPQGFFLVRMFVSEQKEMRSLARACGLQLRDAVGFALREERLKLRERAKILKETGLSNIDFCQLVMRSSGEN